MLVQPGDDEEDAMLTHRHLSILLAPLLALAALSLLRLSVEGAGQIPAQEAALNPAGLAYEVNADPRGDLWISDDGVAEIWQIHPPAGAYTVYQDMSYASDARMDGAGMIWWTDAGFESKLGRISPSAGTVTTWTLPEAGQLWGLAFDDNGLVWATDVFNDRVYSFAPGSGQLCAYPLPDGGASDYLLARGTTIWLGDNANGRIVKLDPAADEFTSWQLLADAYPQGLALDANGDLWWADELRDELARLEPASNRVTAYALPAGTAPAMIALDRGQVWYTGSFSGALGLLGPAVATGASVVVARTSAAVTPDCRALGGGITSAAVTRAGTLAWSSQTYQAVAGAGGRVYQLPSGASPWGLTVSAGQVWAVDQGRQQLIRVAVDQQIEYKVYLPRVSRR
jgi:streptogramin lyase